MPTPFDGSALLFPLARLESLRFLPVLSCFSPYHYRRSLVWFFICLVSTAKMPWATFSWYSFLILCCEDQISYELNCDHAKAQGYSPPWNLKQGALQGKVTFYTVNEFLNLKAYRAVITYCTVHGPTTTAVEDVSLLEQCSALHFLLFSV